MKKLTTLVILIYSVSIVAQSPWTKKKGEGYLQLSFTTIPTYSELFSNPKRTTERELSDNTLQFYGEVGLSDKTTLFTNIPLKFIKSGDIANPKAGVPVNTSEGSETSLGNIQLGIKHNFYNKKSWVLSGQLGVEVNTASYDKTSGLRTGINAWSFTPLFLAGKSFKTSYFQSFIGFDVRTNDYSSNFKFGGEYGGQIFNNFWLIGFIDIVKSFENGKIVLPTNNLLTATYINDQDYGAFGAKFIYEFTEKFGLNAGFGGAFFGNNVAKSPALSIGLYHKF